MLNGGAGLEAGLRADQRPEQALRRRAAGRGVNVA